MSDICEWVASWIRNNTELSWSMLSIQSTNTCIPPIQNQTMPGLKYHFKEADRLREREPHITKIWLWVPDGCPTPTKAGRLTFGPNIRLHFMEPKEKLNKWRKVNTGSIQLPPPTAHTTCTTPWVPVPTWTINQQSQKSRSSRSHQQPKS
jgi:hypothetical protein